MKRTLRPLSRLPFDNRSLRELPVDTSFQPSQRDVPNAIFALVDPTPLENPHLIAYSQDVAENLLEVDLESEPKEKVSAILAGNDKTFGRPAAHCYCGHQFGVFAGQLGDGATMYIGETVNSKAERWEIQFKGAGLTPFSRQADGRKVLRSSIREFLCSEHLHALGIPTTRALSICTSDSRVVRDILYDGHPRLERCTVIIRVAETFIRFGSFEISKPTDAMSGRSGPNFRVKNTQIVKQLCDYVMKYFYPQCNSNVEAFLLEVTRRTAHLVALWQTVGFCHGVLNTDNMSILGKTLDYGPFGFMERFDPHFVCNRSDDQGRYAYSEQPSVCVWNCLKLLEALAMSGGNIVSPPIQPLANKIRDLFLGEYENTYRERMREKLGLDFKRETIQTKDEDDLYKSLFETMNSTAADFTQIFRALGKISSDKLTKDDFTQYIKPCLGNVSALQNVSRPRYDPRQMRMLMELLDKGKADEIKEATGLTSEDIHIEMERINRFTGYSSWSEQEKTSSDERLWIIWFETFSKFPKLPLEERSQRMNRVNPRFVLRNHVAQRAIEDAERGRFEELNKLLQLCVNPYSDDDSKFVNEKDGFRYDAPSEDLSEMCAVSCSS
jgi:uncharacterized protein YdiU (UPF0061 family)